MRLFIAALIPENVQNKLANYIHSLRKDIDGVKWEKPHKLHVTLKFLGDVNESKLKEIIHSVEKSVELCSPFRMTISDFGGFPNLRTPTVLYIGLSQNKELSKYHNKLDSGLSEVGFEKEGRKFIPHITIGRAKKRINIKEAPQISKSSFDITQIGIVKSELRKEGSVYTPLKIFKLDQ